MFPAQVMQNYVLPDDTRRMRTCDRTDQLLKAQRKEGAGGPVRTPQTKLLS